MANKKPKFQPGQSVAEANSRRIRRLRERDGDRCQLCGGFIDFALRSDDQWRASIDHIVPRVYGGRGGENLQLAHAQCNSVRGSRSLDHWWALLFGSRGIPLSKDLVNR